jgi:anti-sigma factor RsiW
MRFLPRSEPREEELAALADDSLAPDRRLALETMVAASPELAERLDEQRRVAATVRGVAASVEAPAGLRARVGAQPQRTAPARRSYLMAGGVAAAAVAALVVVLALPDSVPGGPSVAEAAVVATRPAAGPAPTAATKTLLGRAVDGVAFPNWAEKFGWEATGARTDTVGGRRMTTVFYEKEGRRIAYTIVAGAELDEPEDAPTVRRGATDLRVFSVGGRTAVTWQRGGRTCILSGTSVDTPTLAKLAAWNGRGTIPF